MASCTAIVLAAGRGNRFGEPTPKQYVELAGVPLLCHSLAAFEQHPDVDQILPVIHTNDRQQYDLLVAGPKTLAPAIGGQSRQESVRLGLEALSSDPPDLVLIHDGVRPNPGTGVINRVMKALKDGAQGVIPAIAIPDSIKRIDNEGVITEAVSRSNAVRAQTPQGFIFNLLLKAHQICAGDALTDDAAVFEKLGHRVSTVAGDETNIKVTERNDISRIMDAISEVRTGTGFDVHRFETGKGLVLGGIPIPFEKRLVGHSDADVVLHAAADALFGTIADGDIGVHFPPTDATYKNAPSVMFVRSAIERLHQVQGKLIHLDLTIICELPKLAPYRDAIRQNIADIASVSRSRISVKATTTEGLGFTGRGEGIACQALATVKIMPPF